jgi:hypothetical protein
MPRRRALPRLIAPQWTPDAGAPERPPRECPPTVRPRVPRGRLRPLKDEVITVHAEGAGPALSTVP